MVLYLKHCFVLKALFGWWWWQSHQYSFWWQDWKKKMRTIIMMMMMTMMMMISPVLFPLYNLETRIICTRLNIASHKAILLLQSGDGHDYFYDDDDLSSLWNWWCYNGDDDVIWVMMGMRELRLMMLSVFNSWPSCSNVNCNKDSDDFDNHRHLWGDYIDEFSDENVLWYWFSDNPGLTEVLQFSR